MKSLIIDTREHWTQPNGKDLHIKRYLDRHEIPYEVRKLDVGDYMFDGGKISVDRKSGLDEVARNLTNKADSSRFWREVRRAKETGIRLIVLVESGPSVLDIRDVSKWKSTHSRVTGRSVLTEMIRLEHAYGVRWCFCSKSSTAKRIIELLEEE